MPETRYLPASPESIPKKRGTTYEEIPMGLQVPPAPPGGIQWMQPEGMRVIQPTEILGATPLSPLSPLPPFTERLPTLPTEPAPPPMPVDIAPAKAPTKAKDKEVGSFDFDPESGTGERAGKMYVRADGSTYLKYTKTGEIEEMSPAGEYQKATAKKNLLEDPISAAVAIENVMGQKGIHPERRKEVRARFASALVRAKKMDMGTAIAYVQEGPTAGVGQMLQQMRASMGRSAGATALAPTAKQVEEEAKQRVAAIRRRDEGVEAVFVLYPSGVIKTEVLRSPGRLNKDVRAEMDTLRETVLTFNDLPEKYKKRYRIVNLGGARQYTPEMFTGMAGRIPPGLPAPGFGAAGPGEEPEPAYTEEELRNIQENLNR